MEARATSIRGAVQLSLLSLQFHLPRPSANANANANASNSFSSLPCPFSGAMRVKSRARPRIPLAALRRPSANANKDDQQAQEEEEEDSSSYSVLANLSSPHNDIIIVDTPHSRLLLLDPTHNIHSVLKKQRNWTGSYWDEFATLPPIVPPGPIAILGLGGGTAARLMLQVWPSLQLQGWEIDEILIDMAREYFCLSDLEKFTQAGGSLKVHIGDALSPSVTIPGGFAGIIVDLFSEGKVLPQLKEVNTWLEMDKKLMANGRIMVNCGGNHAEVSANVEGTLTDKSSSGSWIQNSAIKALHQAFPGKLNWKRMAAKESENYLALTGPLPDLNAWSAVLPSPLSLAVKHWTPCELA